MCGNNKLRSSTYKSKELAYENMDVGDFDQENAKLEESLMQASEAEHDSLTLGT